MNFSINEFKEDIKNADMVLIGLGEEFERKQFLQDIPEYVTGKAEIEGSDREYFLPFLDYFFLKKYCGDLTEAYQKLSRLVEDKNYFIISTGMNEILYDSECFPEERIVTPCGGFRKLQCINGCKESLVEISGEQKEFMRLCCEGKDNWNRWNGGVCSQCENILVPNNVYLEHYAEDGYLSQWERYLKWMQGTLNRKVLILELGVGMTYPGIIRWPFEKIAFFNQKAGFYRINESLYQMTEELQNKGISVREDAVKFLLKTV